MSVHMCMYTWEAVKCAWVRCMCAVFVCLCLCGCIMVCDKSVSCFNTVNRSDVSQGWWCNYAITEQMFFCLAFFMLGGLFLTITIVLKLWMEQHRRSHLLLKVWFPFCKWNRCTVDVDLNTSWSSLDTSLLLISHSIVRSHVLEM